MHNLWPILPPESNLCPMGIFRIKQAGEGHKKHNCPVVPSDKKVAFKNKQY